MSWPDLTSWYNDGEQVDNRLGVDVKEGLSLTPNVVTNRLELAATGHQSAIGQIYCSVPGANSMGSSAWVSLSGATYAKTAESDDLITLAASGFGFTWDGTYEALLELHIYLTLYAAATYTLNLRVTLDGSPIPGATAQEYTLASSRPANIPMGCLVTVPSGGVVDVEAMSASAGALTVGHASMIIRAYRS